MRNRKLSFRRKSPSAASKPRVILRLKGMGFAAFCAFILIVARLWYLQVLNTPKYQQAAVSNEVRTAVIAPPRGVITARGGEIMATNQVIPTITLSRLSASQDPAVIGALGALLGMTQSQIEQKLHDPQYNVYQPVPLASQVPLSQIIYLEEHQSAFPGVSVSLITQRFYPNEMTASHLLGYIGQITSSQLAAYAKDGYTQGDIIGQSGVEAAYQKYLRGIPGSIRYAVNAQGQVVGTLNEKAAVPGDTVELTLSLGLQKFVDSTLASRISALHKQGFPAPAGAAVVMNPNNGSILAMASYPTYNPNEWVGGISQANYNALISSTNNEPLINRAISGTYTPGSTFKLATASAALAQGLISPGSVIVDKGTFTVPNCTGPHCTLHNAPGEGGLGPITLHTAISASDDVFFYTLGYRFWINRSTYGTEPIQQEAHAYGLGVPTGIPLPGEATGQVDSPNLRIRQHKFNPQLFPYSGWYVGDNLELAFGQGETLITPIQLAVAYSTFANGGTRYQPRVADAILSPNGHLVKKIAPKVTGHVSLSAADHAAMLQGFIGAVTNPLGTGYYTFLSYPYSKYPIAGKTGTASVAPGQQPNSLFVGFGPLPNPQYVVVMVIDKAGYGDTGAAPGVRSIFEYLMNHPVAPAKL
ncbi:MAG: penicillin-binding protein 2 [Actinobacteria bacterium]|nr:penicillin-binding protein 2 [Actinomycetota bacterium]MCL6105359.1 penicillin-binding protein 2 [Actinomycetota bacterium]